MKNKISAFRAAAIAVSAFLLLVACTGCTMGTAASDAGISASGKADTSAADTLSLNGDTLAATAIACVALDESDTDTAWDDTATVISLDGTSAEVSGQGAAADGAIVTITAGGTYVLRGTLSDGQIVVNTTERVHLVLDGASVTCSSSAAINVIDAKKVVLTLAADTENALADGSTYTAFTDKAASEPNAALFATSDLTINGTGSLSVQGNYNNGIQSKDTLCIVSGTLSVKAAANGIKGKDAVIIKDGSITVDAGADGIKADNTTDTSRGYISIEAGTLHITAAEDGIQAEICTAISGGSLTITSGGGTANAVVKQGQDDFGGGFGGGRGNHGGFGQRDFTGDTDTTTDASATAALSLTAAATADTAATTTETVSTKCIKAGTELWIAGGTFTLSSAEDGLHANSTVNISGGTIDIAAGDDGIHADDRLAISEGTITVTQSYEGLEAEVIDISGGKLAITASDDGLNASDGSGTAGGMGGFGAASATAQLNISGGYLSVNAGGDGLDSNGTLTITGGTAIVNGPTNDGNGALDSGSGILVNGGFLIAAGSSGMAETPEDTSTQMCVSLGLDSQAGGTLVHITDSQGNAVLTFAPAKQFSSFIFSTDALQQGETYTVSVGGTYTGGSETDGLYTGGTYTGGTAALTFTAEAGLTTAGNATNTMGGGFGGGQKPNGGQLPTDGDFKDFPTDGSLPDDFPTDGQFPGGQTPPGGSFPGGGQLPTDSSSTAQS